MDFQLKPGEDLERYGSDLVVWGYNRSAEEFGTDASVHGLPFNVAIAHCETVAEDGSRYLYIRSFVPGFSPNQQLWLVKEGAEHPELLPEDTYRGAVSAAAEGGVLAISSPGVELRVSDGGDRLAMRDVGGKVDLAYSRLGPGVRYACPGLVEDVGFISEHFRVTGTVLGKPVSGLGAFEACFGTPGTMYFQGKVVRLLERAYFHFGNVYVDGSFEYGHFCDGHGHFSWGYVVQNGTFTAERENRSWSPRFEEERLVRGEFSLAGHDWEWTTTGTVAELFAGQPISSVLGYVTRRDDTRKALFRWGWMEARDPGLGLYASA